jgi:hypothetical protein
VSPENDLLVKVLRSRFHHVVDEVWGPLDPHVRSSLSREFKAAYEAVSRAVYLEAEEKKRGQKLVTRIAADLEEICPREPKPPIGGGEGGPPPPEEPIDPVLVGASLVALSHSIRNEGLAKTTFETGTGLMR